MTPDFYKKDCQTRSARKRFGIIDLPPARIDEQNGAAWIAVVENERLQEITFTAVDHCIEMKRPDGNMERRCDGFLTLNDCVLFVELKESGRKGNDWIKEADEQLRITIGLFESTEEAGNYKIKKAYIANSEKPKFRDSQAQRMEQFQADTGYVLRIENRILI